MYLLSLALPGLLYYGRHDEYGYQLLLTGWVGVLTLDFPWFGNLAYFAAVVSLQNREYLTARYTSLGAIFLGLLSFFVKFGGYDIGSTVAISGLGSGFYIWIFSFILMFTGSILLKNIKKSPIVKAVSIDKILDADDFE
jgi:hypothetical protein